MSELYHQLLEATIQHLNQLKGRGVRSVAVTAQTWKALSEKKPVTQRTRGKAAGAAVAHISPPSLEESVRNATAVASRPVATKAPTLVEGTVDKETKLAVYQALRERALACTRCPHLVASRQNVVFGVGDVNASLMFVGEAPGADEDRQAEPFVGAAGKLLTRIIQTMGLTRESVYIANILKCRPDTPGQSSGNRRPTPEEMQTCISFLHEQIDLIRPQVLVALGGIAVEGLLGKTVGITRLRGQWQVYRGIPLMPTYHPAFLLRNQALSEKRRVWEDMLQVMERLCLPISEKQRQFFLK
jgi:DNA polymerase